MKKNIILRYLGLFALSLVIFEISSRLLLWPDFFITMIDDRTERHHFHRIRWIRGRGQQPFDSFDLHHPVYGWTLKSGIKNLEVYDQRILNTNSIGCRGSREFELKKKEGSYRIAIIGDSFSFGSEVSDNQTFAHYLDKMIPNTEVMNFAVHGYGHDQILLRLRNEVVKYRPDLIILGYIDSDDYRNLIDFRDFAKPRFIEHSGKLELIGVPVQTPAQIIKDEPYKLKSIDLALTFYQILLDRGRYTREIKYRSLLLNAIYEEVKKINSKLLIVHLPYVHNRFDDMMPASEQQVSKLFNYGKGIHFVSARKTFVEFNKKGYRYNDSDRFHWGSQSHYTVAISLIDYLKQSGLLPSFSKGVKKLSFPED